MGSVCGGVGVSFPNDSGPAGVVGLSLRLRALGSSRSSGEQKPLLGQEKLRGPLLAARNQSGQFRRTTSKRNGVFSSNGAGPNDSTGDASFVICQFRDYNFLCVAETRKGPRRLTKETEDHVKSNCKAGMKF